jgi:lipid A 3-O-deacylase
LKFVAAFLLMLPAFLTAQTLPSSAESGGPLRKGSTELGAFVGGGTGFGKRSNTQMLYFGGRYGRVLTGEFMPGRLRGNVEFVADVIPFMAVFQPENAYGAGFNPMILKWNFTSGKKLVPFIEAGGGVLFSNKDIPINTGTVNFTPQGGFGFHYFTQPKRAITFTGKYLHISNAGLDRRNSGVNASIQLVLGYTWFK